MLCVTGKKLKWALADSEIKFTSKKSFVEIGIVFGFDDDGLFGKPCRALACYFTKSTSCQRRRPADPTCEPGECVSQEQVWILLHLSVSSK